MRILVAHNTYQQHGGEDVVFASEVALLRSRGHIVKTVTRTNDEIDGVGSRARAAILSTYNPSGREQLAAAIAGFRPDVVHVHNFFPLLSPSIFWACEVAGVPSVWTLHNFRVTCANGLLFREGGPCEECVGRTALPAIRHRCYRNSLAGSATLAAMISLHKLFRTWERRVTRFIALTEFARTVFIRAGLPAEKIKVKANFMDRPLTVQSHNQRAGAVFVGRLSREKGVHTLVEAWRSCPAPLTIVGDGPARNELEALAPSHVTFVGFQSKDEVLNEIARARCLIVPSLWYENFPMTIVEAMALGTPVIASRLGALSEIVKDGETGILFEAGNAQDLLEKVQSALACPIMLTQMGHAARKTYEHQMAPESNILQLESIYHEAISAQVD